MFKTAMSKMNVDVKRMPLGQLSNAQVRFCSVHEKRERLTQPPPPNKRVPWMRPGS